MKKSAAASCSSRSAKTRKERESSQTDKEHRGLPNGSLLNCFAVYWKRLKSQSYSIFRLFPLSRQYSMLRRYSMAREIIKIFRWETKRYMAICLFSHEHITGKLFNEALEAKRDNRGVYATGGDLRICDNLLYVNRVAVQTIENRLFRVAEV